MHVECKSHDELEALVEKVRPFAIDGKVASYIPALEKANPEDLSVSIYTKDGDCYYAGDYTEKFTLQSISKVLTLALVLEDNGEEMVFEKVGMEPTGDPFNSIAKLESSQLSKPLNPMINAGALVVTSLIKGNTATEKWTALQSFIASLLKTDKVEFNHEVADSEFQTADLNRSLCYFMRQDKVIEMDVEELIDIYTKQCAIELNCQQLARIGAIFSLGGKDPITGNSIISEKVARICKTFMVTCGMYNASGRFAIKVGIPAKSGVSGGILGVVPDRFGIGIYGPALDQIGNSIAGWKLLELLNEKYQISIF